MILGYDSFRPETFVDAFRFIWDNPGLMWDKTSEHLVISGEAIAIAILIGVPIGILLGHVHRGSFVAINLANILRALPSLALFQLLVPFTGLTLTTIEIGLVGYTLLILFRNILTGLRSVPEEVLEAGRGMGLTRRQLLTRIELPLAMPAVMAGIRIAVVTTISLATVAAYITPLGLGAPIFYGLQTNFTTEFVATGALAVLLAVTADIALVLIQRVLTPWSRARRPAT